MSTGHKEKRRVVEAGEELLASWYTALKLVRRSERSIVMTEQLLLALRYFNEGRLGAILLVKPIRPLRLLALQGLERRLPIGHVCETSVRLEKRLEKRFPSLTFSGLLREPPQTLRQELTPKQMDELGTSVAEIGEDVHLGMSKKEIRTLMVNLRKEAGRDR